MYTAVVAEPLIDMSRYGTWLKLIRVTAYVLRAVKLFKTKSRSCERELSADEVRQAEIKCCMWVQEVVYKEETEKLKAGKVLPSNSRLLKLDPYDRDDQVLRFRGRLQFADLPEQSKHQIILPHGHPEVAKMVQDVHKNMFGVKGAALEWVRSYLLGRTQRVSVKGAVSENFDLRHGVPQGSCLGPLLFSLYTSKLFYITKQHLPNVICYADDTQLYMSFRPDEFSGSERALDAMSDCIRDLRAWMISDKLMINDGKTEVLLVGTRQQLQKVNIDAITVGSSRVTPCTSVRNLGAWFDSQLTMNTHVNKVCSAAYFHLYNIKRIRKYLSQDTTEKLVHAFSSFLVALTIAIVCFMVCQQSSWTSYSVYKTLRRV